MIPTYTIRYPGEVPSRGKEQHVEGATESIGVYKFADTPRSFLFYGLNHPSLPAIPSLRLLFFFFCPLLFLRSSHSFLKSGCYKSLGPLYQINAGATPHVPAEPSRTASNCEIW